MDVVEEAADEVAVEVVPEEVGVPSRPELEEAEQRVLPGITTTSPQTRATCTKSSGRPLGDVVTVIPVLGGISRAPAQSTIEISSEKLK